jgi:hypothetical protein
MVVHYGKNAVRAICPGCRKPIDEHDMLKGFVNLDTDFGTVTRQYHSECLLRITEAAAKDNAADDVLHKEGMRAEADYNDPML